MDDDAGAAVLSDEIRAVFRGHVSLHFKTITINGVIVYSYYSQGLSLDSRFSMFPAGADAVFEPVATGSLLGGGSVRAGLV